MGTSDSIDEMVETKLYRAKPGWLSAAIAALGGAGIHVLAPKREADRRDGSARIDLAPVTSAEQVDQDFVNVGLPLKSIYFPPTQSLLDYAAVEGGDVRIDEATESVEETVVLGCRPCDAAAVALLDSLFRWDYDDVYYRTRRERTTLVSWACTAPDGQCFCTSVGGSPHGERGSDVLAFLTDDGGALLEVHSVKGERFVERLRDAVEPAGGDAERPTPPDVPERFNTEPIRRWLENNFEDDSWKEVALRCLGCGACSYLCPTCHCFDIVDESTWNRGTRRRNWDSCAFALFTLHASGHNPRADQTARWRQRVMHKFRYFPDRFGDVACVGCGRCVRRCGAGQNLVRILQGIEQRA